MSPDRQPFRTLDFPVYIRGTGSPHWTTRLFGRRRHYCDVLRATAPFVKYVSFTLESLGGLDEEPLGLLARLQGGGGG
jgi:hypothetical protein